MLRDGPQRLDLAPDPDEEQVFYFGPEGLDGRQDRQVRGERRLDPSGGEDVLSRAGDHGQGGESVLRVTLHADDGVDGFRLEHGDGDGGDDSGPLRPFDAGPSSGVERVEGDAELELVAGEVA